MHGVRRRLPGGADGAGRATAPLPPAAPAPAGARRATVLCPPGTTATMVLPDGSSTALGTLNVRATEYAVGASGPAAMPATLPPTSAYTYAGALTIDEAVAAGASHVVFSQ